MDLVQGYSLKTGQKNGFFSSGNLDQLY